MATQAWVHNFILRYATLLTTLLFIQLHVSVQTGKDNVDLLTRCKQIRREEAA